MHFRMFVFPSKFRNKYDFFRNGWQLCITLDISLSKNTQNSIELVTKYLYLCQNNIFPQGYQNVCLAAIDINLDAAKTLRKCVRKEGM